MFERRCVKYRKLGYEIGSAFKWQKRKSQATTARFLMQATCCQDLNRDYPRAFFELGEPVRLLLLHLKDAQIQAMNSVRIVVIENETTFNDYVELQKSTNGSEIIICSGGQANWAVVRLLKLLADSAQICSISHWGDLDRTGLLIVQV